MSYREKIKVFFEKYERHISTFAFVGGFIFDNLTLRRVDLIIDNLVLSGYFFIAGISIIIFNTIESRAASNQYEDEEGEEIIIPRGKLSLFFAKWLPLIIQFAFGALFSGFFVFYSRSASLAASWPFLLFLFALLFSNELVRKHYSRLTFQLSIFFIIAFSYSIFIVPVLLHRMGALIFIISGFLSLLILSLVAWILSKFAKDRYYRSARMLAFSVFVIYIMFNILYFKNIIPPIPLSLKEIGVYHSIVKNLDGNYTVTSEHIPWYHFKERWHYTYHARGNETVSVLSAVFAPTKLNVTVFHEWSYYDAVNKKWVLVNRIPFAISGGRDGGYRGFSIKENASPGLWQVKVVNERGQRLGTITFTIEQSNSPLKLETKIK